LGKPETFDFLGFTHICGNNHKTGYFVVLRQTIGKRMAAKLKAIRQELRGRLKWPPLSRPFLGLNKLRSTGSSSTCSGDRMGSRPLPFRHWNRRSGRIPALPYPPFQLP